jgi:hypothetical protein
MKLFVRQREISCWKSKIFNEQKLQHLAVYKHEALYLLTLTLGKYFRTPADRKEGVNNNRTSKHV